MGQELLAVVAITHNQHVAEILAAAKAHGIETVLVSGTAEEVKAALDELSSAVILWRSSNLTSFGRKQALTAAESRGCIIINRAILHAPEIRSKRRQQELVKLEPSLNGIATYEAAEVPTLNFPVIAKPDRGSQGSGIVLLKSLDELEALNPTEFNDYVFQEFIPNDGDYRVTIVGGAPIGTMKRTASGDEYRNNVSLGATATNVIDPSESHAALTMAARAATVFGLQFCGVDLIKNNLTGEWHFLEINSVPQWDGEGFKKATGVDVAEKLIEYVKSIFALRAGPVHLAVVDWYEKNLQHLPGVNFHWWSRKYLWTGDKRALEKLQTLRGRVYSGQSNSETHFKAIMAEPTKPSKLPTARREMIATHPEIGAISNILARVLFAQTIYRDDLRAAARAAIGDDKLRRLFADLLKSENDLLVMSTTAVNALSFISVLFGDDLEIKLDPHIFLRAMELAAKNPDDYRARNVVYLATHAIIGASAFYSQKIENDLDVYQEILRLAEIIIAERPNEVSLDAQLEFLVANKIISRVTSLESSILERAANSTLPHGVFITDPQKRQGANMFLSEHRNALFVMANSEWSLND